MAITPQHGFSKDRISESVLLSMGMVTQDNALEFHKAFKDISGDSIVAELEARGKIKQTGQRQYQMLVDYNKPRNLFRVSAPVVVVDADTPITVTIANYADATETLSAPAVGLFFRENSTDIVFEVISVNKATAGAHTASIKPVDSRVTAVTIPVADAEFISTGRPKVQEASFQQDGEYTGWGKIENEITMIRTNKAYTDLATMIKLVERGGRSYYDLDNLDLTRQHTDSKEMALIDGDRADSVTSTGNENNNALGLVPLVKEYGTSLDGVGGAGATLNDAFFQDLARAIDGDGRSNNYNGIAGSEAYYAVEDYLRASQTPQIIINNGNEADIRAIFDYELAFKQRGINYDFKKYNYWNSNRLAGADATKSPKAYQMLLIPQGGSLAPDGSFRDYLTLRYLNNNLPSDEGFLNKFDKGGALMGIGTTREALLSVESYVGIEVNDVEAFVFVQLAMTP